MSLVRSAYNIILMYRLPGHLRFLRSLMGPCHKVLCYAPRATVVFFKWSHLAFKILTRLLPNISVLISLIFFIVGAEWSHQKNH